MRPRRCGWFSMTPPPMAIARGAAAQTIAWHSCARAHATESHTASSSRNPATPSRARALSDGPCGETLDAVPVERAGTGEGVARQPSDADVSQLAMSETARRLVVDDQSDANAGPDRNVSEISHAAAAAPAHLRQSGAIDVGVERRRHSRCLLQPMLHLRTAPARLGRAGDPAGVEIEWTEACDPKRGKAFAALPCRKNVREASERLVGGGRRHRLASDDAVGTARQDRDAFGPTELDPCVSFTHQPT